MIEGFIQTVLAGTVRDPETRDAIAGDLIEDHRSQLASCGRAAASLWLARQLVLSFPSLAALRPARSGCGGLPRFVAVFYAVWAALIALGVGLVVALEQLMNTAGAPPATVAFLFVSLATATLGGYAAARVAARAPLTGALSLGVIAAGASIAAVLLDEVHVPLGYWLLLVVILLPATFAGGMLRARQLLARRSL